MTIAAARVMAAGKAGLSSLPFFVDELIAQGIQQLSPWACDHSQDQIAELRQMTSQRRKGDWRQIHYIGNAEPGFTMEPDLAPSRRLLERVNPIAAEATGLPDNPAQMAAWCRRQIWPHCRETIDLWDRYRHDRGVTGAEQLAVVIPFCPEGPTSGTVSMYLGAALRKEFAERNRSHELLVWGIELCPPLDTTGSGDMNADAVQSAFRGYVARHELQNGLPLTDDPDDEDYWRPFDINIAFDGGTVQLGLHTDGDVWDALDRAAAQATACLLNGAAGGDVAESSNRLARGQRWNALLVNVVSELAYGTACRYLGHQVNLPWHRDREEWEQTAAAAQKDAFLRRIGEVQANLEREPDAAVRERIQWLIDIAEEVRSIGWDRSVARFVTRNDVRVRDTLNDAIRGDEYRYEETTKENPPPDTVTPRTDPFCVNITLPENLRRHAAEIMRDNQNYFPIANLLGMAGAAAIRRRVEDMCRQVLEHHAAYSSGVDAQAFFDEILSISVEDRSHGRYNEAFRPSRETLRDFIDEGHRGISGSYSEFDYDLSGKVQSSSGYYGRYGQTKSLGWSVKGVDYDVPVEYSFLVLARVRPDMGFSDISTYDGLKERYDSIVSSPTRWRDLARYYGVKPPAELLGDAPAPAAAPTEEALAVRREGPNSG